jgi:hypothetical protein
MDLTNYDLNQRNASSGVISLTKIREWKKKMVQWKVIDREAASVVYFAVKELVETAEWKFSSEDDCSRKIYDRLAARRREMLHKFDQALSWLQTFVGYLADSRSGINTLEVINATISSSQFLSWNELKSGKTSLPQVVTDISTACNFIPKPDKISWSSFFGAILNLKWTEVRKVATSSFILKNILLSFNSESREIETNLVDYDVGQFRRRTTEQRPRTSNLD